MKEVIARLKISKASFYRLLKNSQWLRI
jgi:predicted DNA-binding transcriptional regulator AlpA